MGLFHEAYLSNKYSGTSSTTSTNPYSYGSGSYSNYGSTIHGDGWTNFGLSLFSFGLEKFGGDDTNTNDGKGGDDDADNDNDGGNEDIQKQIDDLNDKIKGVYTSVAGCNSESDLNTQYKNANAELATLEAKIAGGKDSKTLKAQLARMQQSEGNSQSYSPIASFADFTPATTDISELESKIADAEETERKIVEQKQLIAELQTKQGQIANYKDRIAVLEKKKTEESIGYDVVQETTDIQNFMKALTDFKANANPETAKALYEAYENSSSDKNKGIQNDTVRKAYTMVEKQVNELLKPQAA